ncbi:unnamed protein product [Vitrella brassicaformis CCMP3155]|uniref:Reverse transcriptase domain-containing protein n=1 Tax=Vitrella brassicaformis (strain CCMP3155) TaxID=1169540 RepID=A0A0G4G7Z9_VITBC|nr:unnamed protein product [Vitrella brassicaformis CCMP3155]|eukprot:CEM24748.1 unnamed protein product [Vitrella brassicaformis CCMP3155]
MRGPTKTIPERGLALLRNRTEEQHSAAWRMGIPTEARIPPQARIDMADVMEAADALVSHDGDTNQLDDGFLLFLYIPLLLLFSTKRGGAGGRRKWERRFRLFWEGEWELLLREGADFAPKSTETTPAIHPTPAHPTHDTATQRAFMTAKRLVEPGEFTRAAKKLDSTPVAPATEETYAKLQALHLSRNTPVIKPNVNVEPEAFDVSPKMLAKALRSAAKGAAPGPFGWRFEYLLGYLNLSKHGLRQGEERIPFPKIIRRLLSAKLPQLVTKLLGTANLMALTKGHGKFYGEPAELWYRLADGRVRTILSQQGTQQGDPAGPFLFCLALQPVLKAIQASFPCALIQAFMNDITPGVDESEADGVVDKAEEELQTISLKLARKKSKAYGPHWTDSEPPPDDLLPGFEREGLSGEGIDILGGATGTDSYVANRLQSVLDSHRPLIERLRAFAHEQRQDSSLLFRSCAVPRLYYWLPESAKEKLLEKLPETEVPTLAKLLEGRTKPRLQHDLTAGLMCIEADALLDEFGEESRGRARLRSCRGPGASGWLTTVPAHSGLRFTNEDFVTCCRLRIGATQHPSLASDFCSCGTQLDPYGDHLLCCGTGNERIWRHDLLCKEWRRIIRSVQIAVDREVNLAHLGVYPATNDPDGKRIDLYWVEEEKGMLGDVTIAHPTRPDPFTNRHHAATNRQNGAEDGKALHNAADRKHSNECNRA